VSTLFKYILPHTLHSLSKNVCVLQFTFNDHMLMIRLLNVNNHKRPTRAAMTLLPDILYIFSRSGTRITA